MQSVVDRTGLKGNCAIRIQYPRPPSLIVAAAPAQASDAPSIFTAVQEQLGLKLEAATVTVSALVVNQIERPTED